MIVLNSCLFCLKPICHYKLKPEARGDVRQFFILFQRHISTNSSPSKLKWLLNQVENEVNIWPCLECHGVLKTFNSLYNQMKNLELQTNWIVDKLGDIMTQAPGVDNLQSCFNHLPTSPDDKLPTVKLVKQFRHELQLKCNTQLLQQPRVAMKKLEVIRPLIKVEVDTDSIAEPYQDEILFPMAYFSPTTCTQSDFLVNAETDYLDHSNIRMCHTRDSIQNILKVMTSLKIVFELAMISDWNMKKCHKMEMNIVPVNFREERIRNSIQAERVPTVSYLRNFFKCHKCPQKFGNFSLLKYHWLQCKPKKESVNQINVTPEPVENVQEQTVTSHLPSSNESRHVHVKYPMRDDCSNASLANSCNYCDKKFTRKFNLKKHMRKVHVEHSKSNQFFAPNRCTRNRKFYSRVSKDSPQQNHLKNTHTIHTRSKKSPVLKNRKSSTKVNVNVPSATLKKAEIALKKTKAKSEKIHQTKSAVVSKRKVYSCDKCPYTNLYKCNFDLHLMLHEKSSNKCNLCNYPITTHRQLQFHLTTQHAGKRTSFNNHPSLKQKSVKKLAKSTTTRPSGKCQGRLLYKCSLCPYSTNNNSTGKYRHIKWHKKCTRKCQKCNYPIHSDYHLSLHLTIFHKQKKGAKTWAQNSSTVNLGGSLSQTFACEKCPKMCNSIEQYKCHQLTHSKPSTWPHACFVCDRRFIKKWNMQIHVKKMHPNEQTKMGRYTCPDCGKDCQNGRRYRYHLKTHKSPESWTHYCTVCEKRFITKGNLRKHEKTHSKNQIRQKTNSKTEW